MGASTPISHRLRFVGDRFLSFICTVPLLGTEAIAVIHRHMRGSLSGDMSCSPCLLKMRCGDKQESHSIFSQVRKLFLRWQSPWDYTHLAVRDLSSNLLVQSLMTLKPCLLDKTDSMTLGRVQSRQVSFLWLPILTNGPHRNDHWPFLENHQLPQNFLSHLTLVILTGIKNMALELCRCPLPGSTL